MSGAMGAKYSYMNLLTRLESTFVMQWTRGGAEADRLLLHMTPTYLRCLSWSLVSPSPISLWNTVVSLSSTRSRESDSAMEEGQAQSLNSQQLYHDP